MMSKKDATTDNMDMQEEDVNKNSAAEADELQEEGAEAARSADDGPDAPEQEDESPEAGEPEQAEEKREDENAKYLRLAADFQNFRKRSEKEKSDIYIYANEKFAKDLLEVLDNFERALDQAGPESAEEPFRAGMDMILTQLRNVLAANNVEEIIAIGEVFDPNLHHAVIMDESDSAESGKVTEVMQKGYKLKDRVIRPSMVKVAK